MFLEQARYMHSSAGLTVLGVSTSPRSVRSIRHMWGRRTEPFSLDPHGQAAMARLSGRVGQSNDSGNGVHASGLACLEGDVRAIVALLWAGIRYASVSYRGVPSLRVEKGTSSTLLEFEYRLEEIYKMVVSLHLKHVILPCRFRARQLLPTCVIVK